MSYGFKVIRQDDGTLVVDPPAPMHVPAGAVFTVNGHHAAPGWHTHDTLGISLMRGQSLVISTTTSAAQDARVNAERIETAAQEAEATQEAAAVQEAAASAEPAGA